MLKSYYIFLYMYKNQIYSLYQYNINAFHERLLSDA